MFSLSTVEEVESFERLLAGAFAGRRVPQIIHIPLRDAFRLANTREDGGRLFAALLDLQLSYLFSALDFQEVCGIWNELSRKDLVGGSILDSPDKFRLKLETHRHLASYVLRLRAVWDKILGLLTLLYAPDRYEYLVGDRSRRAAFRAVAADVPTFPTDFGQVVDAAIGHLDDQFRTAEAHGTGVLRKWALAMLAPNEDTTAQLVNHYNAMNQVMRVVGALVRDMTKAPEL